MSGDSWFIPFWNYQPQGPFMVQRNRGGEVRVLAKAEDLGDACLFMTDQPHMDHLQVEVRDVNDVAVLARLSLPNLFDQWVGCKASFDALERSGRILDTYLAAWQAAAQYSHFKYKGLEVEECRSN